MATVLQKMPERVGKSKYPWTEWSDGKIRELKRGVDFKCENLRSAIGAYATKAGLYAITRTRDGGKTIYVQFFSGPAPKKSAKKK